LKEKNERLEGQRKRRAEEEAKKEDRKGRKMKDGSDKQSEQGKDVKKVMEGAMHPSRLARLDADR